MNKRPGRVLIVDDCPTDRAVMSHRLTSNGYQVMEAESGATALRLMMSDRFDLVLLDIIMPGLDGIEVLKRIRLRHSPLALPVIMVTAKNESEDVVESLELGANDYICKPVSLPGKRKTGSAVHPRTPKPAMSGSRARRDGTS